MPVFKLMRRIEETADPVTRAIADVVQGPPKLFFNSPPTFFMEFWNMKQRGELSPDEPAATWAVLMRAVPVSTALQLLLLNCWTGGGTSKEFEALARLTNTYAVHPPAVTSVPYLSKLRTKLVYSLTEAAGVSRFDDARVIDPQDAWLLLSACETALVVKAEDTKRWATNR